MAPGAASGTRRVFFALWPAPPALEQLDRLAAAALARCGGRRMRGDSLHLTLAFIGAVSAAELERLCQAAAQLRAEAFELRLDRLGFWPHNRIVWAGCHQAPPCQRRVYAALAQALAGAGFPLDARPYQPHVTLVRGARGDALPQIAEPIRWRAESFTLVESQLQPSGARYRVLREWPLMPPAMD